MSVLWLLVVASGMIATSLLGMFGRKICIMGLVSRFIPLLPKVATKAHTPPKMMPLIKSIDYSALFSGYL